MGARSAVLEVGWGKFFLVELWDVGCQEGSQEGPRQAQLAAACERVTFAEGDILLPITRILLVFSVEMGAMVASDGMAWGGGCP